MNTTPTLEQILTSRDLRVEEQYRLLEAYPEGVLIVLTVVMPGSVKQCENSQIIGQAGVEEIDRVFGKNIIFRNVRDLFTGYEAYFVVAGTDIDNVKTKTVEIEETHPLGRLMDIDVIGSDGCPVSRRKNGGGGRKCIICDDDARICMRLQRHSYKDILDKINRIVGEYVRGI